MADKEKARKILEDIANRKKIEKGARTHDEVLEVIETKRSNGVISNEVAKYYTQQIEDTFNYANMRKNEIQHGDGFLVRAKDREQYTDMSIKEALGYMYTRIEQKSKDALERTSRFDALSIAVMKNTMLAYVDKYGYIETTFEGKKKMYTLTDVIGFDVLGGKVTMFDFKGAKLDYGKNTPAMKAYLGHTGVDTSNILQEKEMAD